MRFLFSLVPFILFTFFSSLFFLLLLFFLFFLLFVSQQADKASANFDKIEAEVSAVLSQLASEPELDKFRVEYEKLHNVLKQSHESEKRLMTKCRELNAELVAASAKVTGAWWW